MTRFYLVRHGRTAANEAGRVMGHEPEPLSAGGREEAAGAAEWLAGEGPFARLLTSEMERARQTGEILASALGLERGIEPALNEPAFDGWVGKSVEQLKQDDPRFGRYLNRPSEVPVEGPLSLRALVARAARATHRVAGEHPDGQIILVSHADILRGIVASYVGLDLDEMRRLWLDTASVSVLEVDARGGGRLLLLNWRPALRRDGAARPRQEFVVAAPPPR